MGTGGVFKLWEPAEKADPEFGGYKTGRVKEQTWVRDLSKVPGGVEPPPGRVEPAGWQGAAGMETVVSASEWRTRGGEAGGRGAETQTGCEGRV